MLKRIVTFLFLFILLVKIDAAETATKCGLVIDQNQKILHLSGSAYEIGYQHGKFLKKEIATNISRFITPIQSNHIPPVVEHFLDAIPEIIPHIPSTLIEEMQGIADASEQSFNDILILNLFPEMFHCTAITVNGGATSQEELYHVRVLDYSAGKGLQDTAILAIVKPNEGIPFLNVTYAGFVGCVTGMNKEKIVISEIGGKGYGYWNGLPMAFLLRNILQYASTLDSVKSLLRDSPRTCEYYYVFSDGKTKDSFGCYATPDILKFFTPGTKYSKYEPLRNRLESSTDNQSNIYDKTSFVQPKDVLMVLRWDHYDLLKERLLKNYGNINIESLQEAIKFPVAHKSNLHNAIFAPNTLDVWISHAGPLNEPACDQPYHHYNLTTLLNE